MVSRSLALAALVAVLALPGAALAQTTTPDVAPIVPVPSDTGTTPAPVTTPPVTTPAPVTPAPTAPTTPTTPTTPDQQLIGSSGTGGASTIPNPRPIVVLIAIVGGLLLLLLLVVGLARWRAWDPPWLRRARHSCSEASWRLGNTWSEFTDWVRLGR